MNHVRGSGGGAQIRASHSQSDPVSLGKTTFRCHVSCASIGPKLFWAGPRFFGNGSHTVKSRAVDRSTIQFWNFLAKGHST